MATRTTLFNRANFEMYKASPSPVDFNEFPGRTHFGIGQHGWEEMADFVPEWLGRQGP